MERRRERYACHLAARHSVVELRVHDAVNISRQRECIGDLDDVLAARGRP